MSPILIRNLLKLLLLLAFMGFLQLHAPEALAISCCSDCPQGVNVGQPPDCAPGSACYGCWHTCEPHCSAGGCPTTCTTGWCTYSDICGDPQAPACWDCSGPYSYCSDGYRPPSIPAHTPCPAP